jgi:hypothetical protein
LANEFVRIASWWCKLEELQCFAEFWAIQTSFSTSFSTKLLKIKTWKPNRLNFELTSNDKTPRTSVAGARLRLSRSKRKERAHSRGNFALAASGSRRMDQAVMLLVRLFAIQGTGRLSSGVLLN